MKTAQEYKDSIRKMKPTVYAFGEKVEQVVDHPCFEPPLNALALTYELAQNAETESLLTAKSPFTGKLTSRFLHICQTPEDLIKRAELGRFMTPLHGACIGGRCVGTGALNTLFAITYDMDKKLGTSYHQRLLKFLKHVQEEDCVVSGIVTDTKGDRSKTPSQQKDHYLHVVERRADGIVVSGAKAHQSGGALAHYGLVVPTVSLAENEKDFAVAFAVPPNAPGIIHIAEAPASNARRLMDTNEMDFGNYKYGVHGATLIVFDKVFIPNDMIFLNGEYEYAGIMAATFGHYQRLSSASCKAGHCELACGAAALAAEYQGCEKMTHIKDKLVQMSFMATLAFGSAIASGYRARRTESGVCVPDVMMVNAAKLQAVEAVWECSKLAAEIAGGILCTMPTQKDFNNPDIAQYVEKYFQGKPTISTENRVRITRLVEYLVGQGSVVPTESSQGAGPAAVQRLSMRLAFNMDYFKACAEKMSGIKA